MSQKAQKQYKFGAKCKYLRQDVCQFLHTAGIKEAESETNTLSRETTEMIEIIKQFKDEIVTLKIDNDKKITTLAKVYLRELEDLRIENESFRHDLNNQK